MEKHKLSDNKEWQWVSGFENYDRLAFPDRIIRVTAGRGGESFLIIGSEKAVFYDCGMAFCADKLIENIERALKESGKTKVDMMILSHTHYDHIGAITLFRAKWPDAVILGAEKAQRVFESEGARKTITELSQAASILYAGHDTVIPTKGMSLDRIITDGEEIHLGDGEYIEVIEAKGHTDCSLAFLLEPRGIMLASETTGVLQSPESIHVPCLKSYKASLETAKKCKVYHPKVIINPHFGVLPNHMTDTYFDFFIESAEELREFILDFSEQGMNFDEILKAYMDDVWTPEREAEQPWEAFVINSREIVKTILREFKK